MEKQYKCIRSLEVDEVDGDGFRTGNFNFVEEDSIWYESEDAVNVLRSDIHLESIGESDIGWVEISRETLAKDFEEISGECQQCKEGHCSLFDCGGYGNFGS